MSEDLKEILNYVEKKAEQVKKELKMLELLRKYLEEKLSRPAPQIKPQKPVEGLAAAISSARWRAYRSGRGEWCFADELPMEFVDKLRKGPMKLQGYTYFYRQLSGGKEIVARRPATT